MCGRATEAPALSWNEHYNAMGLGLWNKLPHRYNAPPTASLACVRMDEGKRAAFVAQWGLIPSWAKDATIGASGTQRPT